MDDKITFVTIELSNKQVNLENLYHNDKTGKDYARVVAPGGGSYMYPIDSIKVKADNPERVYFIRPEGTEINASYRNEDAAEDAAKEDKYYTKTWKIEELKEAYEVERKKYVENHGFINMEVPTNWGKHFSSENGSFVSLSIPITENGNDTYYSFVVAADRFKESDKNIGMSYFGFPKKKMDTADDYMVNLKTSIKTDDGYVNSFKTISSAELKECVQQAVERSFVKELFVSTQISEKLIRSFSSKDGKALYGVSVPVDDESTGKTAFYEIVVPSERVNAIPDSNMVQLSLFKNGPDGTAYNHIAKRSIADGNGGYDKISVDMKSEEVIAKFETSREKWLRNNDHSLADEVANVENSFHKQGGRR